MCMHIHMQIQMNTHIHIKPCRYPEAYIIKYTYKKMQYTVTLGTLSQALTHAYKIAS